MKKGILSIIVVLVLSTILFGITTKVQALGVDSLLSNSESYIQQREDNTGVIPIAQIIIRVIRGIGNAVALLILTILGVRYIMGSVQEKAEYKQTIWPYVLGAVLIFAGSTLVDVIYTAFQG